MAVAVSGFFWLRGLVGLMDETSSPLSAGAAGALLLTALGSNLVVDAWRGTGLGGLVHQATGTLVTVTSLAGLLLLLAGLRAAAQARQVVFSPAPLLLLAPLGGAFLSEPVWLVLISGVSLVGLAALARLLARLRSAATAA